MSESKTLIVAEYVAEKAHFGQVDKAGMDYIEHPRAVASMVNGVNEKICALLHDVMEDTGYSTSDLKALGFSETVLDALNLMTHDNQVPYLEYVAALKHNRIARTVKLADLRHNSDLSRLDNVNDKDLRRVEKYKKAILLLEE